MFKEIKNPRPLIGIVGVCGSGKTTLSHLLNQQGILSRAIAQEHSYVQNMWYRLTQPIFLVYLEASFEVATFRRKLNWTKQEYLEQIVRLDHAKMHADLLIATDDKAPDEILDLVLSFFQKASNDISK